MNPAEPFRYDGGMHAYLLRPLSVSYDGSPIAEHHQPLLGVSSCETSFSRKPPCQIPVHLAHVPCTSAIHALVAFSGGHHPAYNFLAKSTYCNFAQVIGVISDPKITSPIYSRLVPARSGCVRPSPVSERHGHYSLEGSINLVARRSARPHQRSRLNRTLREPAAL
jgi:hypothetical protein